MAYTTTAVQMALLSTSTATHHHRQFLFSLKQFLSDLKTSSSISITIHRFHTPFGLYPEITLGITTFLHSSNISKPCLVCFLWSRIFPITWQLPAALSPRKPRICRCQIWKAEKQQLLHAIFFHCFKCIFSLHSF